MLWKPGQLFSLRIEQMPLAMLVGFFPEAPRSDAGGRLWLPGESPPPPPAPSVPTKMG